MADDYSSVDDVHDDNDLRREWQKSRIRMDNPCGLVLVKVLAVRSPAPSSAGLHHELFSKYFMTVLVHIREASLAPR